MITPVSTPSSAPDQILIDGLAYLRLSTLLDHLGLDRVYKRDQMTALRRRGYDIRVLGSARLIYIHTADSVRLVASAAVHSQIPTRYRSRIEPFLACFMPKSTDDTASVVQVSIGGKGLRLMLGTAALFCCVDDMAGIMRRPRWRVTSDVLAGPWSEDSLLKLGGALFLDYLSCRAWLSDRGPTRRGVSPYMILDVVDSFLKGLHYSKWDKEVS